MAKRVKKTEPSFFYQAFTKSYTPILVTLLLVASFMLGMLYTKVNYLEKTPLAAALPTPSNPGAVAPSAAPAVAAKAPDIGKFPVMGNKDAKVTVIEFADFRCPFCERFYTQTEPQLKKDYVDTGKIKFAFRNYAFLGPASVLAANAAECANEQGKFWEYYDYLYKNQPPESDTSMYTVDNLSEAAGTLGMDNAQFSTCLSTNKYDKNASDDLAAGQQSGVTGTPTFFINNQIIVGAVPYAQIKAAIDAELNK